MTQSTRRRTYTATRSVAILAAAVLTSGFVVAAARADELAVPAQNDSYSSSTSMPTHGMTMARVQAAFGAPSDRHNAIGKPPITRWDYPSYSVFFEHEYVLHTVAHSAGQ